MRKLGIISCLAIFAAPIALAQTAAPPPDKMFAAAAEIPALIAKAKAERKPDQPLFSQTILSLAPYRAALEYRAGNSPPASHDKDAEMFYVLEGSATLVTGGTLVDAKRTNPLNFTGTSIKGGHEQVIAKGDFAIVPENTPHQVILIGGAPVALMSIHVPRPIPGSP